MFLNVGEVDIPSTATYAMESWPYEQLIEYVRNLDPAGTVDPSTLERSTLNLPPNHAILLPLHKLHGGVAMRNRPFNRKQFFIAFQVETLATKKSTAYSTDRTVLLQSWADGKHGRMYKKDAKVARSRQSEIRSLHAQFQCFDEASVLYEEYLEVREEEERRKEEEERILRENAPVTRKRKAAAEAQMEEDDDEEEEE